MERWRSIDAAGTGEARRLLSACCGSRRWVERMLERRPFRTAGAALAAARDVWFALEPADWLEVFSQHPRIGDVEDLRRRFAASGHLSEREQAGVAGADQDLLAALAEANRAYEARFGHLFIVCATGKSAAEMLALLQARLENEPETEIRVAAEEQARITALRLCGSETPA